MEFSKVYPRTRKSLPQDIFKNTLCPNFNLFWFCSIPLDVKDLSQWNEYATLLILYIKTWSIMSTHDDKLNIYCSSFEAWSGCIMLVKWKMQILRLHRYWPRDKYARYCQHAQSFTGSGNDKFHILLNRNMQIWVEMLIYSSHVSFQYCKRDGQ